MVDFCRTGIGVQTLKQDMFGRNDINCFVQDVYISVHFDLVMDIFTFLFESMSHA
jgi:hypothetical protein